MLDLGQPPYEPYLTLLGDLRASDEARVLVAFDPIHAADRGTSDVNEPERTRLAHLLLLHGTPDDVELVRFLLEQEVLARRNDSFQGAGDTLVILSWLLVQWAAPSPDDTVLFWTAKKANFDTFAGGYPIEFLFTQLAPDEVFRAIEMHGGADDRDTLAKYDVEAIVAGLPAWRTSLAARYPRTLEAMDSHDCEAWAELFGDRAGQEHFGLANATTPEGRARVYRRLERFEDAADAWCEAAMSSETDWDRASRLTSAMTDAARVPMPLTAAVDTLDDLRRRIPSWNEVGLGRMATQACYELAAALDGDEGDRLWRLAESWREQLESFTLTGLRAALEAGEKWGSADQVAGLRSAVDEEQQRIAEMFR